MKSPIKSICMIIFGWHALLPVILFSAAPEAPQMPEMPTDWRQLALHDPTDDNYYYTLLNVTEEEFNNAAIETPPRDRRAVITNKLQARAAAIDIPAPLTPEEKSQVLGELNRAATFLSDQNNAGLYTLLGHPAYAFISRSQNQLLAAFNGKNATEILKMTAQFFSSILQGKSFEEALADANKVELLVRHAKTGIPEQERAIAIALGGILFENIDNKDKQTLVRMIHANPPTDPTNITVRNGILKEYINLLQCRVLGSECKRDTTKKKPEVAEAAKQKEGEKKEAKPETPAAGGPDTKKLMEDFGKAIDKIESALYSLRLAKKSMSNVTSAGERAFIRSKIKQTLEDYSTIKSIASAHRGKEHSNYARLAQIVDDIYKEAGGF